ncbi:MAG: hypothetical protein RLY20_1420 [Verrucomicrobiota bacterium]|jgi:hypothetical protein
MNTTYRPRSLSPRQLALSALALLGLLLLAGCVLTSVYPFYTENDLVFEPKLVGRWADAEHEDNTNKFWQFEREGTNAAFKLTVRDGDEEKSYRASFFRLKSWSFIDATPLQGHDDFIPPHFLMKVSQVEPELKLAVLDYEWVADLLKAHPGALRHTVVEKQPGQAEGGRVVLTADTAELQKFILKYAADTNAFPENVRLARQR